MILDFIIIRTVQNQSRLSSILYSEETKGEREISLATEWSNPFENLWPNATGAA